MGSMVRASDLFIVDNSDSDWKVRSYLSEWCEISKEIDIATGYFEIGSLLALKDKWQKVDKFRILMGDEVSMKTKRAFADGLLKINQRLDLSLENEKKEDAFLTGVPAIVEAIRAGKIEARVYRRDKFHAKAYITHGRMAVIGSFALVGSSNFTYPGLCDNVELNVQIRGPEVGLLQEWYEKHWEDAEDITPDILRTLERHTHPRTPFEIWSKSLFELFRDQSLMPDIWDKTVSRIFPILSKYQQDAYKNLMQIASRNNMAFLCDGVGLGKTFVGLCLIERLVEREGKRVVLLAPKAAREDVWERVIRKYLPKINSGFVSFLLYNHTDLQRKGKVADDIERTLSDSDVVIIDEAHNFRNPGIKGTGTKDPSRYRKLQEWINKNDRPKQLYFLTATPINNSIHDFRHLIEIATNADDRYFASRLGISNLRSHFVGLERRISNLINPEAQLNLEFGPEILEVEQAIKSDDLFSELVVQRSRSYVKESQKQEGDGLALFPSRDVPKVAEYNLKSTYGKLLESVEKAFNKDKPLFVLSIYYPNAYFKGDKPDATFELNFDEGRQRQVVTLIRTLFLKRFESSSKAFEGSCWRLLKKILAFVEVHAISPHDKTRLQRWKTRYSDLIGYVHEHQQELWPVDPDDDETEEVITQDLLEAVERLDPDKYDINNMLQDCHDDLDQLAEFLNLVAKISPDKDDKLKAIIRLLKTDKILQKEKVLIFTEFADTARYLEKALVAAGITSVHRIDGSSTQKQRSNVISRFSPYYNDSSTADLQAKGLDEIRVLITTDVLAEGLNLQDATRLINYDLHWNPVRLMQRIGRVDRRMNPEVEARLIAAHPERQSLRGKIEYWNFLPPDELDTLLRLFQRVNHKTLVISKTLGIEGKKLLKPEDDFEALRELNEQFDGSQSDPEKLLLEYNALLRQFPELAQSLPNMPLKLFSGKQAPTAGTKAVFFCHRIPRPDASMVETESGNLRWSDNAGFTVWSCYDLSGKRILTEPGPIADLIRSTQQTPRHTEAPRTTLMSLLKSVEKQLINDHLRAMQAPVGVSPILKCWMELC